MKYLLQFLLFAAVLAPDWSFGLELEAAPPNVVIIFIDDMGYADIGPFGAESYATPNLDRMAADGRRFTDFHTSAPVCSASRAALMTGCYHERVSIRGALWSLSKAGLHPDETTLAEICKQRGYATGVFGKWHLGRPVEFLPLQQGFDEYFGLPYSNDMWPEADVVGDPIPKYRSRQPKLPLIKGNEVVQEVTWEDQNALTTWYTEHAVDFIDRHHEQPFLLYMPHSMVHVPLGVSEKFRGKSGAGLFGDVVMELDWSVGEIMSALQRHGVAERTLIIFTADNGPWLNYGNHAGSAQPLREGKGTCWEGGHRVPCVMRWPDTIPAGTSCDELTSTIDLLPTVAKLIGAEVPQDRTIDGKDIFPLMSGQPGALSPHQSFYCYYQGNLCGVRDRRWKLALPHRYKSLNGRAGGLDGRGVRYDMNESGLALYDLKSDIGETTDVAGDNPQVVQRLLVQAEIARETLGDKLTNRKGNDVRPSGKVE
ncbi:MAG: sulfatase [Planctomycetota bacterium]